MVVRTYTLSADVEQHMKELAAELEVFPSHMVDCLLERALREVEAGRWRFDRVPTRYVLTWNNRPQVDRF